MHPLNKSLSARSKSITVYDISGVSINHVISIFTNCVFNRLADCLTESAKSSNQLEFEKKPKEITIIIYKEKLSMITRLSQFNIQCICRKAFVNLFTNLIITVH